MSEKGVISKSIASNISEAIIDKLGGAGYTPTEWSKNINLLGIASADIEEALASITEDTSSSDKGLLSLSIASDMGAMLNKKYNTSRGFKPCEVSSAVSALTPLPEKTASSASIASFSDGADDVPTKSLVVTIPPTLTGVSSVSETQTGKNLLKVTGSSVSGELTVTPQTDGTVVVNGQRSTALTWTAGQFVAKGACSIVFSGCSGGSGSTYSINIQKNNAYQTDVYNGDSTVYNLVQGDVVKFVVVVRANVSMSNVIFSPMIRFSAVTDGTFEKYTETQYTASLGRTIYGGIPDVVKGECVEDCVRLVLGDLTWANNASYANVFNGTLPAGFVGDTTTDFVCEVYEKTNSTSVINLDMSIAFNYGRTVLYCHDNRFSTTEDFKAAVQGVHIVYKCTAKATDFTFDGQEIPTRLGYNAFWSDEGDTEVTYRADIDLYEAPSMLLGANNTETEENEEQEENE